MSPQNNRIPSVIETVVVMVLAGLLGGLVAILLDHH